MDLVKDLAVEPIAGEELRFRALTLPKRMGNVGKFAYGGFQLGQCISAAFATVQRDHFCYSIFATFLGPGLLDELLDFKVEIVRTTRTFSTRRVEAFQLQNGERRKIMVLQLDCQAAEAGFVEFSAPPFHKYTHYDRLLDYPADLERKVEKGQLKRSLVDLYHKIFPLMKFAYHLRYCPESTGTQNMMGLLKGVESTQAHLPLTDRSTAVWSKAKERLANHAENVAAMTFYMDGALAFAPLTLSNRFLDDAGALSTLEAAVRFFTPELNHNQWHLQEQRTVAAGAGRTFNVAQLWGDDGKMVAHMSQQCICRPPEKKSKL